MVKPDFHMIISIVSKNLTQMIANDPNHFKIYMIIPIVRIELNIFIQAIEVDSVVRVI